MRAAAHRTGMEPAMHSVRNAIGGKFCTAIFMMGQLIPQHSVKRTSKTQSLRESDVMPEQYHDALQYGLHEQERTRCDLY